VNRLEQTLQRYRRMEGYQATIKASRRTGSGEIIRYFYRRPGYIRMEFEQPHKGALLIYVPDDGIVRLWPFGRGLLPPLSLSPTNPLLQSPTGQRVDRSDVGTLLDNILALKRRGKIEALGAEAVDGRDTTHIAVNGDPGTGPESVHRYDVWFDDETDFPLKVVSSDGAGREIETVLLQDVVIDPSFPPAFFRP